MANFNLNDYELVETRIKMFWADHKDDGAILTELLNVSTAAQHAVVKASILIGGVVKATGLAFEERDKEKGLNKYGKEYETVNFSSWLENAETSAIGRGLSALGYFGNKRASREEMEKVQRWADRGTQPVTDQATMLRDVVERKKHVAGLYARIGLDGEALKKYLADKPHTTVEDLDHLAIEAQELIEAGKKWEAGAWV